jgi:hypothetical protein
LIPASEVPGMKTPRVGSCPAACVFCAWWCGVTAIASESSNATNVARTVPCRPRRRKSVLPSWQDLPRMPVRSARDALERAKARLDPLRLYSEPVRIDRVRVLVAPLLFRLPWFRRFDGYAAWNTILLRERVEVADDDLICHELCHVWQMQHRPLAMPLSYLRTGYERNPYEEEARRAAPPSPGR